MTAQPIERALWEASDGSMHDTEKSARQHSEMLEVRAVIAARMEPEINDLLDQSDVPPDLALDLFAELVYEDRAKLGPLLSDFKSEL